MLAQVVYETNADVILSYEAMVKNQLVVVDRTEKGLVWFKFKENRTVFQLSPLGKLQVKWNDISEKRTLFKLIKNLLITKSNEKLLIKPVKQQTWIEYPVPESFKLYWCDKESEFIVKTSENKDNSVTRQKANDGGGTTFDGLKWVEDSRKIIIEAVEELRRELRYFREPTFNEVVMKSGYRDVRTIRMFIDSCGWKNESSLSARLGGKEAINLAGWLQYKQSGDLNPRLIGLAKDALDRAMVEDIKRAQTILENYPELAPSVIGKKLVWPEETKEEWIRIFGCYPPEPITWKY